MSSTLCHITMCGLCLQMAQCSCMAGTEQTFTCQENKTDPNDKDEQSNQAGFKHHFCSVNYKRATPKMKLYDRHWEKPTYLRFLRKFKLK